MLPVVWCLFILLFSVGSGSPEPSGGGVKWGEVVAGISILVNILMAVFAFLMNRKNSADERLRKAEADRSAGELVALRTSFEASIAQLRVELSVLQRDSGTYADASDFNDLRADVRDLRKTVSDVGMGMASHHSACVDKFVQRTSYSEDNRAQRETIKLIYEAIQQQAAIIEKLRS